MNITVARPAHETQLARTAFEPIMEPEQLIIEPPAMPLIPRRIPGLRHASRRAALQFTAVAFASVMIFGIIQNLVAQHRVSNATKLNASGQYMEASAELLDMPSLLVLGGIQHNAEVQAKQNKRWLTYLGYQDKARQLIDAKQYAQAILELQKITDDYPTYESVESAIQFARSAMGNTDALAPVSQTTGTGTADTSPPTTPGSTGTSSSGTVTITPQAVIKTPKTPQTPQTPPPPNPIILTSLCRVDASPIMDIYSVAQNISATCQSQFPHIESLLSSAVYAAPHPIGFKMGTGVAAYASGNNVVIDIDYLRSQPDDMGMVVHELTHVVQAYPGGPGWITEGIADYVRYELGYATSWSNYNCNAKRYTDGYGCAATLLRYARNHYDGSIIKELHAAMRSNTYTDNLFVNKTGKTPAQLWTECRLSDCVGGNA